MTNFFFLIQTFVMLKAATRLEFNWSTNDRDPQKKGWIPRVHFAKATHTERASDRVEGRISGRVKFMLLILAFVSNHFLTSPSVYILKPRIPQSVEEPHHLDFLSLYLSTILGCIESLGSSLYITGSIIQFVMNYHSRTYAGPSETVTFSLLVSESLALLGMVPHVVGRSTRPDGVSRIRFLILAMDVVQSVGYRSVGNPDAEDEE